MRSWFISLGEGYCKLPNLYHSPGLLHGSQGGRCPQQKRQAARTLKELRALNPHRKIVIGSTQWNSASTLKDLALYKDENTFHFYAPFSFTHQRDVLQASTLLYNREIPYPGDIERYRDYCRFYGQQDPLSQYERMDSRFLRDLRPVDTFLAAHPDKILYCGEFGTIRHCRLEWREN